MKRLSGYAAAALALAVVTPLVLGTGDDPGPSTAAAAAFTGERGTQAPSRTVPVQPAGALDITGNGPPVEIDEVQPLAGGKAVVAPLTAVKSGEEDRWMLKLDFYLRNTGPAPVDATEIRVSYAGAGAPSSWSEPVDVTIAPGGTEVVQLLDGFKRYLETPVPDSASVEIEFEQFDTLVTAEYDLVEHTSPVPGGAYFFPAKAADLKPGEYWSWGARHMGSKPGTTWSGRSRYAYDAGVGRWDSDADKWVGYRDGADPSDLDNADSLVWNKPLYAMADGQVMFCREQLADHEGSGGGSANVVWIKHGTEYAGYVHLKQNSIPSGICPAGMDNSWGMNGNAVTVKAGQQIGRVGNTGSSSAPHLHLEVLADPPPGNPGANPRADGVPVLFQNVLARGDKKAFNPETDPFEWTHAHGQAIGWDSLFRPNSCGFDPIPSGAAEVARHGITAACYQDVVNRVNAAGYRPVWVDGYTVAGKTYYNAVFRPKNGTPWVARHGLTAGQYQAEVDKWTAKGYRPLQIDGYAQGGQARYAAIFVKQPGPQWQASHGLTATEHQAKFQQLTAAGWRPVNISGVSDGGVMRYYALYEKASLGNYLAKSAVLVAEYQSVFDTQLAQGKRPIYLNSFSHQGKAYLSVIFSSKATGPYAARHGLSSAQYQDEWEHWTGKGYLTRNVTGYDSGGTARFAAVWRPRPNTKITVHPTAATASQQGSFSFTADVPLARFRCKLDGGAYQPCSSPHQIGPLPPGEHTFQVRAVDREGVSDPSPAKWTWLIDVTAPQVTIVHPEQGKSYVNGEQTNSQGKPKVIGELQVEAIAADEETDIVSVFFTVDGVVVPAADVTFDADTGQFSFDWEPPEPGQAEHTLVARATNAAGLQGSDSVTFMSAG